MKSTIDHSAVTAIAYAALESVPHKLRYDAEWYQPQNAAWEPLGLDGSMFDTDEDLARALEAYRTGFQFALQLGARIGADPLHAFEIKDLIKSYRLERKEAA